MNYFYNVVVSQDERSRVESLEPFDEYEEWHLKCAHYILLTAFNGSCQHLSALMWPQLSSYAAEIDGDSFSRNSSRNMDTECGEFVAMAKQSPTSNSMEQLDYLSGCEVRELASSDGAEPSEMELNGSLGFQGSNARPSVCVSTLSQHGPCWKGVELSFIGDGTDSRCQRFGHTADVLAINGQRHLVTVGGFGVASCGQHRRLSDISIWNLSTMVSDTYSIDSSGLLARTCHATVMLGNSVLRNFATGDLMSDSFSLVIVGGRYSPASPAQDYVVSVDFDTTFLSASSISCHAVVCSGDVPDACWRHSVVLSVIDGTSFFFDF